METTPTTPAHPESHLFAHQLHGKTLLLSSLTQLGSLTEPEITHEAEDLLELISTSQPTNVVIDLSQSDYLGTAMLSTFIRLWKRIAHCGGSLVLCNVSQNVAKILRFTKLDTIWTIYGSRDQALHAIGG